MTDKSQEISSYKGWKPLIIDDKKTSTAHETHLLPQHISHYWLDPEIEILYKRVIRSSNS